MSKMSIIELSQPNHPYTHPWGVSQQIINFQMELNYLDKFKIYSIFGELTWPPPINPPIDPSQIFKQN